ncbi:hypothetical protein TSAR_010224 [Trichomalopsis sarcophagae]|uniref:histone acetyltransferase n=1 Tax=Trichomalopsis sarcophagae TaxID=543379 RepID=A0A232FMG9_9HYME|nr:hypothetical protein TSAR_010224 [Trichomalopsis sarcophagae]
MDLSKQRMINGNVNKIYCQNNEYGCHLIVYFRQASGLRSFPIELSYLLSKIVSIPGIPEKQLSDLGRLSYHSFWKSVVLEYLDSHRVVKLGALDRRDHKGNGFSGHDIATYPTPKYQSPEEKEEKDTSSESASLALMNQTPPCVSTPVVTMPEKILRVKIRKKIRGRKIGGARRQILPMKHKTLPQQRTKLLKKKEVKDVDKISGHAAGTEQDIKDDTLNESKSIVTMSKTT